MRNFISLIIVTFICSGLYAQGQIINVPDDQPTIQGAINAAADGDTVLVADGTYYENINFKGKAVTVASWFLIDGDETHIDSTIIDGSQSTNPDSGSVVYFISGENSRSVLWGFTVTGGRGNYSYSYDAQGGGGIFVVNSGAKIQFNKIINNSLEHGNSYGGGVLVESPKFKVFVINNIIEGNNLIGITNPSAGGGGIFCYKVPTNRLLIADNVIRNNACFGDSSRAEGLGGGIYLLSSNPEIRNNLLVGNSAKHGGGIGGESFPGSDKPIMINNTIASNIALTAGGGFYITGAPTTIMNSILWGNSAVVEDQISGNLFVQYSDIQGGYYGTGNISEDPLFVDTANYYLGSSSPCVDAGNPNSSYEDREDPASPGSPLLPSLGNLRGDMGAFGGDPYKTIIAEYSPQFQTFYDNINSTTPSERQLIADSFLDEINSFPFIENQTHCYFIYTGAANTINVPGDANSWNEEAFPMKNIYGTDFWFYYSEFEEDARLDYQFVINGSNWILDTLNENTCVGGYGPNSELSMPAYIQPTEIEYRASITHGKTTDILFASTVLNNSRVIQVYTPPEYENNSLEDYPVILFHDGLDYVTLGSALNVLDYLISENLIEPVIAVFVPPVNRDEEYAGTQSEEFSTFIIDELMPHIDSTYRTKTDPDYRAMTGFSYGGLITTQICCQRPESFGLCAPYSTSFWANDRIVFNEVVNGPKKDIKWYVDWGTYEGSITSASRAFVNHLENEEYELEWNEWHEGHSWGHWRAHLDEALTYFFPPDSVTDVKGNSDLTAKIFALSQNYPNPFNPATTINYSIPYMKKSPPGRGRSELNEVTVRNGGGSMHVKLVVYDILGREVAILVNEHQRPGSYEVQFNAAALSSGVYFYKLTAGKFIDTKKLMLVK